MSTATTNYGLVKPELTDAADITAMNGNWDTLDTKLKEVSDKATDPSVLSGKVDKIGDTMTGTLDFNNLDQFRAISKTRTINGTNYYINWGCGVLGGEGIVAMELHLPSTTGGTDTFLGRIEIGSRGVSFLDANNKRTYLHNSGLTAASVES